MAQLTITLKVKVLESATESRQITLTFPGLATVGEANEQIRERVRTESASDMMLFRVKEDPHAVAAAQPSSGHSFRRKKDHKKEKDAQPEVPPEPIGTWLKPNITLDEYDLSTDDILVFRKRHKVITVKTADASSKAVIVDLLRPVKDVVTVIGEKFGLDRTEEYSLQWERTERWLIATQPITEQGNTNEVLVLKKRFYVTDAQLDKNSPTQLHLAYIQGREGVVSGMHPVTKEEAVLFAGFQAQVQYGTFNPTTHKPGFLDLSEFLPPMYLKVKDIENLVLNSWKGVGNMTTIEAKYKYHLLCMTLATYGKTMYNVQYNEAPKGKKPQLVPFKLAFSSSMLQQLSNDYKTVIRQHKYQHLKKWTFDDNSILFDFGDHEPQGPILFYTPQGEDIATLIGGYIDILVRINRSKTAEEAAGPGIIAEVQSMGTSKGKVHVGMSVSVGTMAGSFNEEVAQVKDLGTLHEVFQSYHVPTTKELGPPPVGVALTSEQLVTQMGTSSTSLRKIMGELQQATTVHNVQEVSNLSKNMAMILNNFLSDAKRAATHSKEAGHKQTLLNACTTVVHSLSTYVQKLQGFESDQSPAKLAELEVSKRELENAVEGVLVAMRTHQVEPENGSLLLELANTVDYSVKHMIQVAKKSAPGNPDVETACKVAEDCGAQLIATVNMLGKYAADKEMRERINTQMKRIKPSVASILQAVSMANPSAMPTVMSEMKSVDSDLRVTQQALEESLIDLNAKMLPYFRAAHTVVYESAKIAANPDNAAQLASSAERIKECVPVIIARAKDMNDEMTNNTSSTGSLAPTNLNVLGIARQIALATKTIVQQSQAAPGTQPNPELVRKSGTALNQAVTSLLNDEELLMHKVVLVDRAKLAAASVMRIAELVRDNIDAGKIPPERAEVLSQRVNGAFDAVHQLLAAIRQAVGTEGDERVNINHLAEMAAAFCSGAAVNVIFPINAEGPEYAEVCAAAGRDAQALLEETQQYRIVGRLADIEYATETFHAAESVLQALLFANEADKFTKVGTREEAIAMLPPAASQFGNALKSVAQTVKQSQSFIQPLQDLSRSTQAIICVARGLITNSRFKHERTLLVDAARALTIDVDKLIEALKRYAREDTEGVVDAVASSIAGSVSALQRIVSYAQNEGGQLVLEESEIISKCDAELESRAEETLVSVKELVDETLTQMNTLSSSLPPPTDPRSTVNVAVVDSVSALVASTSTVVGAAYEAQNELVKNLAQPATRMIYARDPSLADALIKAARHVQMSIIDLTRGLSADTIETLSQQELATHAGTVSKAVEILASAVRAGTKQQSTSLVEATRTVSEATSSLLEAAKMIEEIPAEAEEETEVENFGIDAYTLQEIKLQMKIAQLEHQLNKARKKADELMKTTTASQMWNVI